MKNKIIISVLTVILVCMSVIFGYKIYQKEKEYKNNIQKRNEERDILNQIIDNYNEYVVTKSDVNLYYLNNDNNNYEKIGQVSKDITLHLEFLDSLSLDNKYFKLKDSDYYVSYQDVSRGEQEDTPNTNYKHYVPFDTDIVTNNPTNFYKDGKIVYSINNSFTLPIIINDTSYYYVEFNNELLAIKKDDVSKTVENKKNIEIATGIGVLNYHFFYQYQWEGCNETICLDVNRFEEQLKYLKDNNFYTASMEDMSLWMDKKIRLPKKTAVITVDDGALGTDTHLPRLLEKYDLHGTLFLITAWWGKEKYVSPNLEIQSHGNNIHNYLGEALYKTKAELLDDFSKSINALDGEKTAFCYPFYSHNETVRSAVRESGFKIAFAGGNVKATQNNDRYQINRYVIFDTTSLEQFKLMVN